MNYAEDDDGDDRELPPPTLRDVVDELRFKLFPQRYTDETSDATELLWQLTLEQRATRLWLIVLCVLVALGPITAVIIYKIIG